MAKLDDFYEAQGRRDGAFCNFSLQKQKEFLLRAHIEVLSKVERNLAGVDS